MAKNRLDFQAQMSRHSHDISAGYMSSIAPGPIVPQFFDILGPGDSVYYRTHMFARLQDVVTAFVGEIDLHIDYFFVPLQMLYTPFGNTFMQTDDYLTSLYADMTQKENYPTLSESIPCSRKNSGKDGIHVDCFGKQIARLLDAFNMNPLCRVGANVISAEGATVTNQVIETMCHQGAVAPWIPAAYQAIYQKYYRNDELETFNIRAYNFDSAYNTLSVGSTSIEAEYFKPRYAQRPSDYFTTVRVSPIASSVNKMQDLTASSRYPSDGGFFDNLLYKVNEFLSPYPASFGVQRFNYNLAGTPNNSSFSSVSSTNFTQQSNEANYTYLNTQQIRALFAVDKFARIWGRADKTYDDQILAHFGIKIPHDVKHDLTHLKHYRAVLQSDPVYSTANVALSDDSTLVSSLGQVGGQGQVTIDTDTEKFTAPVHGVFMAVAYVVTKPRYFGTFSKLHHVTSRLKFPIPEFDKLGAQPLYGFEFYPMYLNPTTVEDVGAPQSQFFGWQNRYQEFKKKYNRVSLTYHDPTQYEYFNASTNPGLIHNNYSPWSISKLPLGNPLDDMSVIEASHYIDAGVMFEREDALNTIMVNEYKGDWDNDWFESPHLMFQSDPIITDFMCYCKKVSWMSEIGEPDLN